MSSLYTPPHQFSKRVKANTVKISRFFHVIDQRGKNSLKLYIRRKKLVTTRENHDYVNEND